MADVIPAIIAENYKELEEKIKSIEGICEWIHIDAMDGRFVAQKTFNQPAELALLKTPLKLEAHLMIEHPWDFIDDWLRVKINPVRSSHGVLNPVFAAQKHSSPRQAAEYSASNGIKRIIVHYEAVSFRFDAENVFDEMITKCHLAGCEFGIAINPETPIEVLEPYILKIDIAFVMGVKPGRAGQLFKENVLIKIKSLREMYPGVKIEVDGGVNLGTAPAILKARADILVVGSYIWESEDKKAAMEALKNII